MDNSYWSLIFMYCRYKAQSKEHVKIGEIAKLNCGISNTHVVITFEICCNTAIIVRGEGGEGRGGCRL
jgi:hypothetical protein